MFAQAWFDAHAAASRALGCVPALVTAVDRGAWLVRTAAGEAHAALAGRLQHRTTRSGALPCVGDWVAVAQAADGAAVRIHHVLPRRSALRRRAAGAANASQMIAANVDTCFLVQACHFDFNPARLGRYLVMAAEGGVEPVVVLTKTDLVPPEVLAGQTARVRAATPARLITLSNATGAGLAEFEALLTAGRTYCLLGSSGVGKTTLINRLLGAEAHATRAVSATGEGVHTTSRRQLLELPGGALLIDTPGMRELGLLDVDEAALEAGFAPIAALAGQCRFADCTHAHEPGCAVRAAVAAGTLDAAECANYQKLRREAEFHALSAQEKRTKDRMFGKMVKAGQKRPPRDEA